MTSTSKTLRYQLESKVGKKGSKHTCPGCGEPREFTRYVDTRTGELLPEDYGMCNNVNKCGWSVSPYYKSASGMSYADAVYQHWKDNNSRPFLHKQPTKATLRKDTPSPIHAIPDEVFRQSLNHYNRNQFVQLLIQHFGVSVANDLLQRFQIGTSSRWPGASVFWYIDEEGRKRGGQIKLFGSDWHTEKYIDRRGRKRSKTSWIHSALTYQLEKAGLSLPDWLAVYNEKGESSPCLFGLPQLLTEPANKPVAIVEAPKTAILCTPYFPRFVWMAIGSLSYLNAERLVSVKNRHIILFPDLSIDGSAFTRWSWTADQLKEQGFSIIVSDYLEQQPTTDQQKKDGLDLADWIVDEWKGYPPSWDV